jgi:hypothetical protein
MGSFSSQVSLWSNEAKSHRETGNVWGSASELPHIGMRELGYLCTDHPQFMMVGLRIFQLYDSAEAT